MVLRRGLSRVVGDVPHTNGRASSSCLVSRGTGASLSSALEDGVSVPQWDPRCSARALWRACKLERAPSVFSKVALAVWDQSYRILASRRSRWQTSPSKMGFLVAVCWGRRVRSQ